MRHFLLWLFLILALAAPLAARAATLPELVQRLAAADFDEKSRIVEQLAASGDPKAVQALTALGDGKLFVGPDGAIAIGEDGGSDFINFQTGKKLTGIDFSSMEKVRVNNRLRRQIDGMVARLSLMSPDKSVRRAAAAAAFTAKDPETLPALQEAIAAEKDSGVRKDMEQARAAIVISSDGGEDDKIAAVAVLADRGGEDSRNLIAAAMPNAGEKLRLAGDVAIKQINSSLALWGAAQNAWYGVSLASVLLLAAIGLSITFGVMGIINMAHGEMVMLGAYTTFLVQQACLRWAPGLLDYSLVLAVPAAFAVSGAIGVAIERGIIRYLYNRPLETLLATWGVSLVLQQTVRSIFGPTNQEVISPPWMSDAFRLGQLTITYNRLWIVVFSLAVLFLLMALLRRTPFGLQTRAVTQNRRMAAAMGIRTDWIDAMTFGLGSGIAGIAGVALSQIDNVSPNLGQSYIIDSFMVVVFGGVGNLWGTLVGALSLGVLNKFLEPYAGAVLGKILVLVLIILFIQRRPRGLFALKGRAIDS